MDGTLCCVNRLFGAVVMVVMVVMVHVTFALTAVLCFGSPFEALM